MRLQHSLITSKLHKSQIRAFRAALVEFWKKKQNKAKPSHNSINYPRCSIAFTFAYSFSQNDGALPGTQNWIYLSYLTIRKNSTQNSSKLFLILSVSLFSGLTITDGLKNVSHAVKFSCELKTFLSYCSQVLSALR